MKKTERIMAFAMCGIAALCLIFAIVCFAAPVGGLVGCAVYDETYGGDAYTGIQNAAAQTATNVYYLGRNLENFAVIVKLIGGFSFIIAALTFAVQGVSKLIACKSEVVTVNPEVNE